ncbi:MAG: DoxX family membrane protein [Elusimicrobia bacterium]|nr:DoxX family membrane protein [Elusimicrobiota bacterium]
MNERGAFGASLTGAAPEGRRATAAPYEGAAEPSGWQAVDPWLGLSARVILALVFIISGTLKAAAPAEEFALVIENYGLLTSRDLIMIAAAFLPWFEVVFGFALLFGFLTRAAAAAIGGMVLVFAAAISYTLLKDIRLPNCGCFGFGFHPTPSQELALNAAWAACAVQAFRQGARRLSLDNWCRAAD